MGKQGASALASGREFTHEMAKLRQTVCTDTPWEAGELDAPYLKRIPG